MKEHNRKAKKTTPLKIEEVSELQTPRHEELFCENACKLSEKVRKW
jgi:hypothetical protein